jgi:basic amino acid/polyamine antiporter, APA family
VQIDDKPGLVRSIRRWDLVALTINAVIGAGIFGLPSKAFALVGSWSIVSFLACAVSATLIALCFAEVASRFSSTGGPYLYSRAAFGRVTGFEVGWLTWLARLTAFAANANLLVQYLGFFFPSAASGAGRTVLILAAVCPLVVINILGIRDVTITGNIFTVGKLVPLAFFACAGLFFAAPSRLSLGAFPGYHPFSMSVLLSLYAFTGFEMAVIPGGEARNPKRDLPAALLIGMSVIVSLYVLIQIACIGALPELASSQRPLADAATRFLGPSGALLITAGILISLAGNLNALILSASRILFAMAEREDLPAFLARIHPRFCTPSWSVAVTGAAMLGLTLSGTFLSQLTISTIARLAAYLFTCAAVIVFRMKRDAPPAAVAIPAGPVLAVCAIGIALWLLSNSSWNEARNTGLAAAAGLLVYRASRR